MTTATKYYESHINGIVFWKCSECDGNIAMIKENGDNSTAYPKFCPKCGIKFIEYTQKFTGIQ